MFDQLFKPIMEISPLLSKGTLGFASSTLTCWQPELIYRYIGNVFKQVQLPIYKAETSSLRYLFKKVFSKIDSLLVFSLKQHFGSQRKSLRNRPLIASVMLIRRGTNRGRLERPQNRPMGRQSNHACFYIKIWQFSNIETVDVEY